MHVPFRHLVLTGSFLGCSLLCLPVYAAEPPFIAEEEPQTFRVPEEEPEQAKLPDQSSLNEEVKNIPQFAVKTVKFHGGSVFSNQQLQAMVQPITGKKVSKTELAATLKVITQAYLNAGYPLSFAHLPKQSLAGGELIIVLVEGHISDSELIISDADVKARISRLVAKLQQEKPLTRKGFERYVTLIKNTPGYRFKVNVPKPTTTGGGTTIRVQETEARTADRSFNLDGDQDEVRVQLGLTLNSLTSHADRLTLSGLVPSGSIDSYLSVAYQQDIGDDGLQLNLSANHFESNGEDDFFITDIPVNNEEEKTRDRFRLGLKYPLALTRTSNWWLGADLHYLDEESNYLLTPEGFSPIDIVKSLRYSALEVNTSWQDLNRVRLWRLSGSIKQGLDLGNNKNEINQDGEIRRGSEAIYFTYLKLDGLWRRSLAPQWRLTSKASLFFSDDILPSGERIRYGGKRFGRGYDDGQAQGDRGIAAEFELRYLKPVNGGLVKRVEPYIAVDTAHTELRQGDVDSSISSYALGVELTDTRFYSLGLEYAKPTGDPHVEADDHSPFYNLHVRWKF